jgi:hypothetical protein
MTLIYIIYMKSLFSDRQCAVIVQLEISDVTSISEQKMVNNISLAIFPSLKGNHFRKYLLVYANKKEILF